MKAIDIACPACKAEPKKKCINVGYGDEAMTKGGVHVSRKRRAHYATVAERSTKGAQ